ncbi:hypothetical protein P261_01680 [Lachnospiraceae bacterium TWA4]|nr:hypothetical protein P261_01680 [Lachnospiraceae bacterium TWA4]
MTGGSLSYLELPSKKINLSQVLSFVYIQDRKPLILACKALLEDDTCPTTSLRIGLLGKNELYYEFDIEISKKIQVDEVSSLIVILRKTKKEEKSNEELLAKALYYMKDVYEEVLLVNLLKGECLNLEGNHLRYIEWLKEFSSRKVYPSDKEYFVKQLIACFDERSFQCRILKEAKFQWFLVETHQSKEGQLFILFKDIDYQVKQEFLNNYRKNCLDSELVQVYDKILEVNRGLYRVEWIMGNWKRTPLLKDADELPRYLLDYIFPDDYERCLELFYSNKKRKASFKTIKSAIKI